MGLPTGFLSPGFLLRSNPRPELFFNMYIFLLNFHNEDVSKQHFAGGPTWRASLSFAAWWPPSTSLVSEREAKGTLDDSGGESELLRGGGAGGGREGASERAREGPGGGRGGG